MIEVAPETVAPASCGEDADNNPPPLYMIPSIIPVHYCQNEETCFTRKNSHTECTHEKIAMVTPKMPPRGISHHLLRVRKMETSKEPQTAMCNE